MFSQDEYHSETCLVEATDYVPGTTSESPTAYPCRLSTEEKDTKPASRENDLPPIDGGIQAWLFLTASAVLEALVWGKSLPSGIFYHEHSTDVFRVRRCVWDLPGLLQCT